MFDDLGSIILKQSENRLASPAPPASRLLLTSEQPAPSRRRGDPAIGSVPLSTARGQQVRAA